MTRLASSTRVADASVATSGTRARQQPDPQQRRTRLAARERMLVLGVVCVAVMLASAGAVMAVVRVTERVEEGRARDALHGTLATVFERQAEFRGAEARFATWEELAGRGVRLPRSQTVERSTASPSHWFVSLRDRQTGIVCDRVGELFDDAGDRPPRCRGPQRTASPQGD